MKVYRLTGNEIGPNGCGAIHFSNKAVAEEHRREYNSGLDAYAEPCGEPEKIVINNSQELAAALDDAMGYGAS